MSRRHQHAFHLSSRTPLRIRTRTQRSPRLGCSILFLLMFVAGGILLAGVTLGMWGLHRDWETQAAAYDRAPGCHGAPGERASRVECVWRRATVLRADVTEDDSGEDTSYKYFLTVRLNGGSTDREEIPNEGSWSSVSSGETVMAETWRGHVIAIAHGKSRFPTTNNPAYRREHPGMLVLLGMTAFTAVYVGLLVIGAHRILREQTA